MDYKQEMVKRLRDDCKILIEKKIPRALENVNDEKGQGINTYRNLTKALAENIKLIDEYDWKLIHSEYTTGEEKQKQVAVWEQNSNGDIRNHKIWDVDNTERSNEFSNCFKDNIELTDVQISLMSLKNDIKCIRGEGSTFGCLMSAINYAGSIPNSTIGVFCSNSPALNCIYKMTMYEILKFTKCGTVGFVDGTNMRMMVITMKNNSKIFIANYTYETLACIDFDIIYLACDKSRYVKDVLKKTIRDCKKVIDFEVVDDGKVYFDMKARMLRRI